jgi:glycosyltransferase involved in cell wall biosynthesis
MVVNERDGIERTLKIAMIGQKGIPAVSGGVEKHVEEISRRLVERGHEVTVYNRQGYNDSAEKIYKGIDVKNIYSLNIKGIGAFIYSILASLHAAFADYDIVHYHAVGPAAMCLIPGIFGKKIVVTVHAADWERGKWGMFAKAYLKAGSWICEQFAERIITVSEKLMHYYKKSGRKLCCIPNGIVKQDRAEPGIIKRFSLSRKNYILFLSRIVPEKGCHFLIEAFKGIDTGYKLVIAGGSCETDSYLNRLKRNESGSIIFTGEVGGILLKELYSSAFCYVLPSTVEGMSIGLLEAMSYGLCPLVSDIEENMVVINGDKQYGFSFKSADVCSLRDKLSYMLSHPEQVNEMGKEASTYVLQKYSWSNAVDSLEKIYRSVVY